MVSKVTSDPHDLDRANSPCILSVASIHHGQPLDHEISERPACRTSPSQKFPSTWKVSTQRTGRRAVGLRLQAQSPPDEELEPASVLTKKKVGAEDVEDGVFAMDLEEPATPEAERSVWELLNYNAAIHIQMRSVVEAVVEVYLHDIVRETYHRCAEDRVAAAQATFDDGE